MYDVEDVTRCIAGYSKIPNKLGHFEQVIEYKFIKPISIEFLQKLFNVNTNDDDSEESDPFLLDCYIIDQEKARILQPFLEEQLDLEKYNFRLECYSNEKSSYEFTSENIEDDLKRFIAVWPKYPDKNGNKSETHLEFQNNISINFLRKLFNVDKEQLLTFKEIELQHVKALQPYINEKFDLEKYQYTLRAIHKDLFEHLKNEAKQ